MNNQIVTIDINWPDECVKFVLRDEKHRASEISNKFAYCAPTGLFINQLSSMLFNKGYDPSNAEAIVNTLQKATYENIYESSEFVWDDWCQNYLEDFNEDIFDIFGDPIIEKFREKCLHIIECFQRQNKEN